MYAITLSPKFQIAIPRPIREQLSLEPGQKLEAVCVGNHIQLVPIKPLKSLRGFLKGINTSVEREKDRDL